MRNYRAALLPDNPKSMSQADSQSERLAGLEGLLDWGHPKDGM
jgi:hypothetical protein